MPCKSMVEEIQRKKLDNRQQQQIKFLLTLRFGISMLFMRDHQGSRYSLLRDAIEGVVKYFISPATQCPLALDLARKKFGLLVLLSQH